jgi:hypothetical protein
MDPSLRWDDEERKAVVTGESQDNPRRNLTTDATTPPSRRIAVQAGAQFLSYPSDPTT